MKQKKRVEEKFTILAKSGTVASVRIEKFAKRKPFRIQMYDLGTDGQFHRKDQVIFLKSTVTGDCPECHQMPCSHTAKLLGWPQK